MSEIVEAELHVADKPSGTYRATAPEAVGAQECHLLRSQADPVLGPRLVHADTGAVQSGDERLGSDLW
jgi:hypothetical protein